MAQMRLTKDDSLGWGKLTPYRDNERETYKRPCLGASETASPQPETLGDLAFPLDGKRRVPRITSAAAL